MSLSFVFASFPLKKEDEEEKGGRPQVDNRRLSKENII
jgi:hypothetical protein